MRLTFRTVKVGWSNIDDVLVADADADGRAGRRGEGGAHEQHRREQEGPD